ncbi:hypothetical protein KZX45_16350 [Georgenia sp. EYE_87]|uniref:hypothetical protein n=1 Tax=Georgenia sp. EYE_87 TaxID=2853448 RepID=UPI0020048948|nr:hypothetical protein [Georgenia sp. EYE_87]MCK6212116.1 hypothetical protein [Georgenia sp. EYE_87]
MVSATRRVSRSPGAALPDPSLELGDPRRLVRRGPGPHSQSISACLTRFRNVSGRIPMVRDPMVARLVSGSFLASIAIRVARSSSSTLYLAATIAVRTNTFLGERYRCLGRQRCKKETRVVVGRSVLIVIWHVLSALEARFVDLGPDFYDCHPKPTHRNHVHDLDNLGFKVPLKKIA